MKGSIIFGLLGFLVLLWSCSAQPANRSNLNTDITVNCSWMTMNESGRDGVLIKGENVMLSDLVKVDGRMKKFCTTWFERSEGADVALVVLASNTFVVDEDLDDRDLLMVVISPKWVVLGRRRMSLDGRSRGTRTLVEGFKYVSTSDLGGDGQTGLPGSTGGTFLGIGEQFVNGQNLTITANGGKGGPGSGGGNGGNGWDGLHTVIEEDDIKCKTARICMLNKTIKALSTSHFCDNHYRMEEFNCSGQWTLDSKTSTETCRFEIYGTDGGLGGEGGRGGSGGPGGHPGVIELFDISGKSGISLQNEVGDPGANGKGGAGGTGGLRGDTIVYSITEERGKVVKASKEVKKNHERGKNGSVGEMKPVASDNPFPQRKQIGTAIAEKILIEYREFIREILKKPNPFREKYLGDFYSQVDRNTYAKRCSKYTVEQLMDNLRELEEDYHKFSKPEDFLVLYETLLHKIRTHSGPACSQEWSQEISVKYKVGQKARETQIQPQNMKVLRYMYTATLGRVYSMKDHTETVVITDIGEYLHSVHKVVQELQLVKGERNKFLMVLSKLNMVQQYKTDFGKYIANKLEEANELITRYILPEIEKINKMTMDNIDRLLKEIETQKRDTREQIEELEEKETKLKEAMRVRAVFGVFKIIGTALSFLPGVGSVVGAGINLATAVGEKAYEMYSADEFEPIEFGEVRNSLVEFNNVYNNYQEEKKEKNQEGDSKASTHIANPGPTANENDKGNEKKTDKRVDIVEKKDKVREAGMKSAQAISTGIKNVVRKYKEDKSKLGRIQEQIEKGKEQLENIEQLENVVIGQIRPTLKLMGDDMKSASKVLEGKSHASLDVAKWKIQGSLKDVMRTMKKVTKNYKVQDDMTSCIEKMQDTMGTLVELFDQIQDYQEQLNLANFIADVSAASATDVNITNTHFLNITHHLELMISSNLVLQKYHEAVNAFKQFVFPFAQLYFDGLTLPSHMTVGDSLEDLVDTATIQVNHLVKRLNDYKQTIKKQDKIIGVGKFSSEYQSTKPFYVWNNANHRGTISKLLSCEEVTLIADVKNSPKDEDAIKFKAIEFSFKVTREHKHLQSKLDNALKKFEIMATHMGTSYYRYKNETYMIMTNSLTFWYNIEKGKDSMPVRRDGSFDKMIGGDYALSPYAVWRVQLSDLTDEYRCGNLREFTDKVDVELVGDGHYVRAGMKNRMQLDVESYYKKLDTVQPGVLEEKRNTQVDLLVKIAEKKSLARREEKSKQKELDLIMEKNLKIAIEEYTEPLYLSIPQIKEAVEK